MAVKTVAAAGFLNWYAPPAIRLLHDPHFQIPTTSRFMFCLPQNGHVNLLCWLTSILRSTLRIEAPYLVPYFPVMPTFLVRFPIVK